MSDEIDVVRLDVKVIDNDHLRITPPGGGDFYFRRLNASKK